MTHPIADTELTCLTARECVAYETFYDAAKAYYARRVVWGLSLDKPCSGALRTLYLTLHRSFEDGWLLAHLDEVRWLSHELMARARPDTTP